MFNILERKDRSIFQCVASGHFWFWGWGPKECVQAMLAYCRIYTNKGYMASTWNIHAIITLAGLNAKVAWKVVIFLVTRKKKGTFNMSSLTFQAIVSSVMSDPAILWWQNLDLSSTFLLFSGWIKIYISNVYFAKIWSNLIIIKSKSKLLYTVKITSKLKARHGQKQNRTNNDFMRFLI